jgi:hypothetical protein
MQSARTLLTSLIDYAGLFPPAARRMQEAVQRYTRHRQGPDQWALGRFVVPCSGLEEFERSAASAGIETAGRPWLLSALAGPDLRSDINRIEEFNLRRAQAGDGFQATVDTVEVKVSTADEVEKVLGEAPSETVFYLEVPLNSVLDAVLTAVARGGGRAKIRTGGTTAPLFPEPSGISRFLYGCRAAGIPFKATAGLHHAIRGSYPVTYDPGSPRALMHGFLNVFLAAGFVRQGMEPDMTTRLLLETDPSAFRFEEDGIFWRSHSITTSEIAGTRQDFAVSFGSCSFREPVQDLRRLRFLRDAARD